MWWESLLAIIIALIVITTALAAYGKSRRNITTKALRQRLEATRVTTHRKVFDESALTGLPDPVRRYFSTVLKQGQAIVTAVRIHIDGTFNRSETREQWKPFSSDQRVITNRPGFDWNARITMAPFLPVYVHDAYVAGEGILQARLLGLITVAEMRGSPAVAEGELMRFLAEAPWHPTSLLPTEGVHWEEIDDSSAKATLSDGTAVVTLIFRFNDAGLITSVRAEARGRTVNNTVVPTPWEGHWRSYQWKSGMLVPTEGEVAWDMEAGPLPYWRGRITQIEYEFAE